MLFGTMLFVLVCRELAPSTISLTDDLVQGDDSKQYLYYTVIFKMHNNITQTKPFSKKQVNNGDHYL